MDLTPAFSRTASIPVDPDHGYSRVVIEMSVPALPAPGGHAKFAEHVDAGGQPSDVVIAVARGGLVVSEDLGSSWEYLPLPELEGVDLWSAFTTAAGSHLVHARTAATRGVACDDPRADGPLALFDSSWGLVGDLTRGLANWHGSRSIGEANGVIVYGEYPENAGRFADDFDLANPTREQRARLYDSRLLRSTDGGCTWETVLAVDWRIIRHFHTVAADPSCPGRWWASSGDRPSECRVWESLDHGRTWRQMPVEVAEGMLHPRHERYRQHVLRYTDVVVRDDDVLWGCDDLLGGGSVEDADVPTARRAGSRVFRTPKQAPWVPESIGCVGKPIRSLVDVGPAYLMATEAKGPLGYCPEVVLLSKSEPFRLTPLMTIDNFGRSPATGFTHSRASRAAKEGVFFTHRGSWDGFPGGAHIMRWRIAFDD